MSSNEVINDSYYLFVEVVAQRYAQLMRGAKPKIDLRAHKFTTLARQEGWLRSRMRDIVYRDEYSHFLEPWKLEDDSAEVFARDLLRLAGPNA